MIKFKLMLIYDLYFGIKRFYMIKSILVAASIGLLGFNAIAQPTKDSDNNEFNEYFKPMKWRSIGPFRGGRSVTSTGVVGNINTYYMGTTGGGLWKTQDMGISWNNISDGYFKTGSVGAITVAESDPNVVYVGMGEHAIRGVMTHHGDGMYKSTDAGKTWRKIGLDLTQHIARIVVDPKDPNIVLVAAQGPLYSKSAERGIYKSTDGGSTWKKVLYIDDKTGCAEISMDMNNPRIIYAAMWEHGRLPWKIISGGPGSGLYKSTDGGEHWEKMQDGLPKEMGKMSIAVCRSNSEKVYALIESDFEKEAGGLYVSNDAGKNWNQVTNDHRLIQRAWYYIELFTDPQNDNTLYVLSAPALKSTDGGKTWSNMSTMHGDHHDLWINPSNSNNMVISDDGGASISFNKGKSWSSQQNMPTAQFYRINVDNQFPYRIYGGQQDNSSVSIASRVLTGGSIGVSDWTSSAGGESAFLAFNPDDPRYVMGGSYQGTIEVLDTKTKTTYNIMAAPIQYLSMDAKDMKYRYNWNAPIIWSKHEPGTFYHGSQLLLKTTDMGKTWTEVSPDLTRNEKEKQGKPGVPFTNEAVGAENYGTLSYVIEHPKEKGVIYTGSDDGVVSLTKDGGKTWKNITPAGLAECLINAIEVSPFDNATAYIATTRYKFNDHKPGLYKTTDYGKTWTKIDAGIPEGAFTRVVREDQVIKDLLFAGTETGVYISWNGGKNWKPFQLNLPLTPITDLKIHQGNLIAATSGRSFWILDDLSMIRQYKKDSSFMVFTPAPNYITNSYSDLDESDSEFTGANQFKGVNAASGIVLYYQLPTLKDSIDITLTITDSKGNLVRSFSSAEDKNHKRYDGAPPADPILNRSKGLNRFVWNMLYPTMKGVTNVYVEAGYRAHKASPGKYTFTLQAGNQKQQTIAEILPNPLYNFSAADYELYHQTLNGVETELSTMHTMVTLLDGKRAQIEMMLKNISSEEKYKLVKTAGEALVKKMKAWDEEMVQRKTKAYDDAENFPNKFTANYLFLINQMQHDLPIVTQSALNRTKEMNVEWAQLKAKADAMNTLEIPAFNKLCWEAGIGAVWKN
jgi:photosystem II stability/assembly factor-like uncharacterized protein